MKPLVFAAMALVLTAGAAGAIEKTASLLEPGTRVRVRLLDALPAATAEDSLGLGRFRGGALHVGTVRALGPRALDLRGEDPPADLRVPLGFMAGLEIEHRRSHAARGGLIGALSGVAMGVWMASQVPDREDPALMAIVFGSGGAAIGGILGALIGSTSHVVAWRPVPVDSLRHAAPPGDD